MPHARYQVEGLGQGTPALRFVLPVETHFQTRVHDGHEDLQDPEPYHVCGRQPGFVDGFRVKARFFLEFSKRPRQRRLTGLEGARYRPPLPIVTAACAAKEEQRRDGPFDPCDDHDHAGAVHGIRHPDKALGR